MSQILNRVRDVDPSDSEAVKETLSAFFQNLLKYKDVDSNRWLRALENVINRFPKYCGTHRPVIESYLVHFLGSNNFYNVIEAAKCAHAVQQVRPSQEKTATAKSCWREQMAALCEAAHKLIEAMFAKNTGTYGGKKNKKVQQVTPVSTLQGALLDIDSLAGVKDSNFNKSDILTTRLRNVLVYIQAMLVEIYPVAKPIQPKLVLQVILQSLSSPGSEDSASVTTIKIQALRTLDALVACLGSNLIPYSALIFRFVMQTLKWSSDNPSEESRKVRISAYASLSKWLDVLHVHRPATESKARAWHDELTQHVVGDVTPLRRTVQLTVNASQPMKNLSKKARKRLANTMLKESSMAAHMPGEKNKLNMSDKSNEEVAIAALECAETFLSVCGIFLKTTTHKQYQELLVRECFSISAYSEERSMCLLRALEASRKNCSNKVPPPTQYCLQLYSVLINSPQREISKFCSAALLDIRLHLHCSPASLNFSLEEQSQNKEKEEGNKHRVTERNRAALEKLLGIEWNSEVPTEEVVVIPDEPATKRARVDEDIPENVSISSDSVHSVELNSDSDELIILAADVEPNESVIDKDRNALSAIESIHKEIQVGASNEGTDGTDPITANESVQVIDLDHVDDLGIHNEATQLPINRKLDVDGQENDTGNDDAEVEKIMDTSDNDINEATTQLQQNSDVIDGKSPLSLEVAYDLRNTGKTVKALDKIDDENLPSTNETDDIQITCGQVVKSSQDVDTEKRVDTEISPIINEVPKVNGIKSSEMNGDTVDEEATSKIVPNDKAVTVEDMLADFVDEVNEEAQA